jgi:prepilin-type N-terminal cleavage/methylation domain-containing protein
MINMTNIDTKQQAGQKGFTIVELMLATAVFSIILLVALGSFLQIGRLFYKGVSLTSLQNVATQALNDITNNIQTASSVSAVTSTGTGGYTYFCIDNYRYTYTTHSYNSQQVSNTADPSASVPNYSSGSAGTFGLLKDNSGCGVPCQTGGPNSGCFNQTNPVEMLGANMRLANITITNVAQNLYNIKMVVAYGDDSVLNFSLVAPYAACISGSANQAFCSVVTTSTTVLRGSQI